MVILCTTDFFELVQDSLPMVKTGVFFVSFCIFEGA
jgi:hypothetical protein